LGGCSGSGELVPAILLASKAKERAHKLQGQKRNRKTTASRVCHSLEQRGHGGGFTAEVFAGVGGEEGVPAIGWVRE